MENTEDLLKELQGVLKDLEKHQSLMKEEMKKQEKEVYSFDMFMSLAKLYESMFGDPDFLDDEENKMFFYGILDATMNHLEKRGYEIID